MISRTDNRHWIQVVVLLVGMVASLSLQAETPAASPVVAEGIEEQGAMCMGGGKGHGREMMKQHHDQMADDLKLDDKQRKLFEDASAKMHDTMKDGMSLHRELKTLVHSDQYDEKQVRALVQKHNSEMEEKTVVAANAMHAFHESLSPEQKEKFKSMKSEMREKMKERMQDRKHGGSAEGEKPAAEHDHNH